MKVFIEAMQASYEGKENKMTEAQAQEVMMKFLTEQQTKAAPIDQSACSQTPSGECEFLVLP